MIAMLDFWISAFCCPGATMDTHSSRTAQSPAGKPCSGGRPTTNRQLPRAKCGQRPPAHAPARRWHPCALMPQAMLPAHPCRRAPYPSQLRCGRSHCRRTTMEAQALGHRAECLSKGTWISAYWKLKTFIILVWGADCACQSASDGYTGDAKAFG